MAEIIGHEVDMYCWLLDVLSGKNVLCNQPTITQEKQDVLSHVGVELPVQRRLQSLLGL